MNYTRYTLAQINLNLTANKLLFRWRTCKDEEKKDNIMIQVKDLDFVKAVLSDLKSENESLYHKLTETQLELFKMQNKAINEKNYEL